MGFAIASKERQLTQQHLKLPFEQWNYKRLCLSSFVTFRKSDKHGQFMELIAAITSTA